MCENSCHKQEAEGGCGFRRYRQSALIVAVLASLFPGLLTSGCAHKVVRNIIPSENVSKLRAEANESSFLKVHMKNGQVYILQPWIADESTRTISGKGQVVDANRSQVTTGEFQIPLDSVAMFETNDRRPSSSVAVLSVITGLSAAVTVMCIANPKACFGSCPTFYADDGTGPSLQAEGFSSSVAPFLEATDVDALYRVKATGRELRLTMTNEALETHMIKRADLLIAERSENERVVKDNKGDFWDVSKFTSPSVCSGPEGDCLDQLSRFDGLERFSLTDSTDLAAKETITLEFQDVPDGDLGLVLACRQSLLSTYLFYQTLAFLGEKAGSVLAALERGDATLRDRIGSVGGQLGGIGVFVEDSAGGWVQAGTINETGPLATDVHLVRLPDVTGKDPRVELRLNRGHWRIDYTALVRIDRAALVDTLTPSQVNSSGAEDSKALSRLIDTTQYLVTFPGDEYELVYELPRDASEYELFLQSRGYYLEWMRDEWVAEQDLGKAAQLLLDPSQALRDLAPQYKVTETELEDMFWNSRYAGTKN
jgi:hypothetical protein